ncbi:hypothetical protein DYU11_28860 [Fibrisoma montanum]|uniref:Outer membrane protein beta-barrel domain-containing protein n=1 Tax=Fibrisoma montanum TaxID=2305895 RepID=A0A418LYB1_9BACT|nr:hypothetical protein [Fibrisoma montanum]RIV18253.1 hypothetical protein DYU11_28860 [Fibrisoma montanum]
MKPFNKNGWLTGLLFLYFCPASNVEAQAPAFRPTFMNMTEVGLSLGRVTSGSQWAQTTQNRTSFTAQTFNGVRIWPRLAVGGTVGIDWYLASLLMPVSAGVRYDVAVQSKKGVGLFTSLDAGYGLAWLHRDLPNYKTSGGLYVSPGVGLRLGQPGRGNFVLSVAYKRQESAVVKPLDNFYLKRDENRIYNRITFRMGVAF